jgi:nucleoside-diphosphate-sugar epimerase
MKIFVTGGTGVLGRQFLPLCEAAGVEAVAPRHADLDLFDPAAVQTAVAGFDGIVHLATRIPWPHFTEEQRAAAWEENSRLRIETTRSLLAGACKHGVGLFIQASTPFSYPAEGPVDETTPLVFDDRGPSPMVTAEREVEAFTAHGSRGVILRFGLLWGPYTGSDVPDGRRGATLHVADAGSALIAAIEMPAGTYNVNADGERVSNALFKRTTGWAPTR